MELDNVLMTPTHVSAHSVQSGEDVARTGVLQSGLRPQGPLASAGKHRQPRCGAEDIR